jgi:carbon monoxide dehydrogenase subunit G
MASFSARKTSQATVAHPRDLVWEVLTDPDTVARLTPMVRSITAEDDLWHWQLARISVLGQSFELGFTEAMSYDPRSRISFSHRPRGEERAGTEGRYDLSDADDQKATHLRIELEVTVELPFPRLARPAIEATMQGVLAAMGSGFSRSIEKELRTRAARGR